MFLNLFFIENRAALLTGKIIFFFGLAFYWSEDCLQQPAMICLSNYLHKSVKIQTSCMAKWFHKKELQGLTFKPKYNFAYWSKMKLWFVFISLNQAQFHKINCFEHFFTNWSCSTTNLIFSNQKQFWTNSSNSKIPLRWRISNIWIAFFKTNVRVA